MLFRSADPVVRYAVFFRDPVSFPERYLRRLQQLQIPWGGLLLFYRIRRLRWLLRPLYSLYPLRLFSAGRAANRRAPPQLILRIPLRRSLSCFPRQKKRYLFAIYELGQTGKPIRSKDIASSLKLKPPSVSKMLNALSEDDLIEKEFYGTVTFTQSGAAMANQLYMDYLTLFAFFHQALEIPEFHARKDAILCLCDLSEPSRKKIASVILDSRGVS